MFSVWCIPEPVQRVHALMDFDAACTAGTSGWAIPSNYPELSNGQILRLDWFILFFQFITAVIVAIVASLGAIPQVHMPSFVLVIT